jgi:hypothetical protein
MSCLIWGIQAGYFLGIGIELNLSYSSKSSTLALDVASVRLLTLNLP